MTIPTLHQNITEKVTVTKLKKVHSTFESAFRLATIDNGALDTWGLEVTDGTAEGETEDNGTGAEKMLNILSKYMNIINNCGRKAGCFPKTKYMPLVGNAEAGGGSWDEASGFARAQLADGTTFALFISSSDCSIVYPNSPALKNICGLFYVDINAFNRPNIVGKDAFWFWIGKNGVIPTGTQNDPVYPFDSTCSMNTTTGSNGRGCTAWVIYNENMDYLHCSDLSWNGQKKCKS